jgi:hypothetical protein
VYGQGHEKVLALHDWMGDAATYEAMISGSTVPRSPIARRSAKHVREGTLLTGGLWC